MLNVCRGRNHAPMIALVTMLLLVLLMVVAVSGCAKENELMDVAVCTGVVEDQCPRPMEEVPANTAAIYAAGRLENAQVDTQLTGTLTNLEADEPLELATTTITVKEVTSSNESFPVFYFTNTDPWTRGRYSIEIRVEDSQEEPVTVEFKVV